MVRAGGLDESPWCEGRQTPRLRPGMELLEVRAMLSTFTVTDNSDNPVDTGSLRYAILHEPGGTTIDFADNVTSPITLTNGSLNITTNLDIEGPGAGSLTVDGNDASTVFSVATGVTATIAGLTIAHGFASSLASSQTVGGGIANDGTLTVTGTTLSNNSAGDSGYGGGIANYGTLSITDSTLSNNSAGPNGTGGGIYNGYGTLIVTHSTLSNNSASAGGGIDNGGSAMVADCTLSSNSAANAGGIETPAR